MTLKKAAEKVRAAGRGEDTMLVHLTPKEVGGLQGLAQAAGGSLTVNPKTGLPEAGFLDSLLPTLLGFGANFLLPGSGMIVGGLAGAMQNKKNPLMGAIMGGMGGYGGGQLAAGLQGAGAGAAQAAAMQGAGTQATSAAAQEAARQAAIQAAQQQALTGGQFALDAASGVLAPGSAAAGQSAAMTAGQGVMNEAAAKGAGFYMNQPAMQQITQGAKAAFNDPSQFVQGMGGLMPTAKAAGMAAAPMAYDYMYGQKPKEEGDSEEVLPQYDYTAGLTGDYYGTGGDGSTRERSYFTTPTFTRRAAAGGLMGYADGGMVEDPNASAMAMQQLQGQGGQMTGASAAAMDYLMGKTSASPATQAQQQRIEEMGKIKPVTSTPVKAPSGVAGALSGLFNLNRRSQLGSDAGAGYEVFQERDGYDFDPTTGQFTDRYKEVKRYLPAPQSSMGWDGGGYAQGGSVGLQQNDFIVPADVVAYAGGGSSNAGLAALQQTVGAQPIRGPGTGLSDSIPAKIDGRQPARVADSEARVPAARVAALGKGDVKKGTKKLYAMLDDVRRQAVGTTKQVRPVNLKKALA